MWLISETDDAIRAFRKLSPENKHRYRQAVIDLCNYSDPQLLGVQKHGKYKGYYAYEMGKSLRLIYKIFDNEKRILVVTVGDHKAVYGYD